MHTAFRKVAKSLTYLPGALGWGQGCGGGFYPQLSECVLAFRHPKVHKGFSASNPHSLKTVPRVGLPDLACRF